MEALRVGGIASGLDTNSIIDALMATAQAPITRLNNEITELTYEKTVYNDILDQLTALDEAIFDLQLESTMKGKNATSSNTGVLTAEASTSTPAGSYTINVSQVAKPAYASSIYLNKSLITAGAGVTGLTSDVYAYDQVEGMHNVNVSSNDAGDLWIAKDVFESKGGQVYHKNSGTATTGGTSGLRIDAYGVARGSSDEEVSMVFQYDGQDYELNVNLDYEAGTMMSAIAQDLEAQINAAMEMSFDTGGLQQVAVRAEYDETTGSHSLSFYDVAADKEIDIFGFRSAADPTAISLTAESLGISLLTNREETDTIVTTITAASAEDLQEKISGGNTDADINNKGGLFPGASLTFDSSGLTEGSFQVYQDSSVNARPATNSQFVGASFTTITDATTKDEIDAWLSSALNDTANSLLEEPATSSTAGTITINDTEIEITNEMTINEIMARVNSSGAGVVMKYDYNNNNFVIENNEEGPIQMTLGDFGDTSDLFSILNISVAQGGEFKYGQTSGSIDSGANIVDAGFSTAVNSGVFTVNGVSIYVDKDNDSVDDIIDKVNKSGAGVTMSYDYVTDKFSLMADGTDRIELGSEHDTSNFLQAAGLTYFTKDPTFVGSSGTQAVFTVNGTQYTRDNNEIDDVLNGVQLSLVGVGTSVLNVEVDTDTAVEAIAEVVAEYNKMLEMLSPTSITDQDRDDYGSPLTDDAKASMSEDEIAEYQSNYERVMYYDITRSSELRSLKTSIRSIMQREIAIPGNPYDSLASLGITTAGSAEGDISITQLGFLVTPSTDPEEIAEFLREETTLVDKIANNAEDVFDFFAIQEISDITTGTVAYEGWARVVGGFLDDQTTVTSALSSKASTNGTIDSNISRLQEEIETQTARAEAYLELMWARFAAMEQQVQYFNTQASYLTNISGGSTTTA